MGSWGNFVIHTILGGRFVCDTSNSLLCTTLIPRKRMYFFCRARYTTAAQALDR
jgi:hypothetical protein